MFALSACSGMQPEQLAENSSLQAAPMSSSSAADSQRTSGQTGASTLGTSLNLEFEIRKLYREILLREADAAGLAYWVSFVRRGGGLDGVRRSLLVSDEYFQLKIREYYKLYLKRDAEPAGLQYWLNVLKSGVSLETVRAAIANSEEARRPGLQTQLRSLYLEILKREPDAAGLDYWIMRMNQGMSLEDVRRAILVSDEYFQLKIREFYRLYLKRDAEAAGLQYWLSALKSGVSLEAVRSAIANSEEARRLGVQESIRSLYRELLVREADAAGLKYWTDQVMLGMSLQQVRANIMISDEYFQVKLREYYRTYLKRDPDAAGFQYWLDVLRSGVSLDVVRSAIANSEEARRILNP